MSIGRERDLYKAYQLGRKALDEGENLLDVTRFHAEQLLSILSGLEEGAHQKAIADAHSFFSEFLSPFDMTSRGFVDAAAILKKEIDERRDAEQALLQSERYFKSLIENALDIVTILDREGNLVYMSPSAERVLGYKHDQFTGRNIMEFIHPADVDLVLELFEAGRKSPFSAARVEFRFKNGNGEWLTLESIGSKLPDNPFVRDMVLLNSRDVTERKNLEEIRRKFEFIINASNELMLLLNSRSEVEAVNQAWRLALTRKKEEIIGSRLDDVVDNELLRHTLGASVSRCLEGTEAKDEGWFLLEGAGRRYLEIDCYPYSSSYSNVTHAIVMVRDNTDRKLIEEDAIERQRKQAEDLKRYTLLAQNAQEDERRRISRELHDDICQRLTALNFQLNVFEDLSKGRKPVGVRRINILRDEINNLISEVRKISYDLRPSALDHFGLVTALKLLCSEFEKLHGIKVRFESEVASHTRFDPEIEIALYRIAQEAMTNCTKHANATMASLKLEADSSELSLSLVDNGDGFELEAYLDETDEGKHFGLINMRERTELLGGTFSLVSAPGEGTTLNATVPNKLSKSK